MQGYQFRREKTPSEEEQRADHLSGQNSLLAPHHTSFRVLLSLAYRSETQCKIQNGIALLSSDPIRDFVSVSLPQPTCST